MLSFLQSRPSLRHLAGVKSRLARPLRRDVREWDAQFLQATFIAIHGSVTVQARSLNVSF